jgi:hypothetical protein
VSTLEVRASTVLVGLGLMAFLATPCQAQSEVAPDIYDANGIVGVTPQPQKVLPRQDKQQAADFQGRFTLPYELQCAGRVLAPGDYSLFFHSVGANRMVTVRGKGAIMKIRPPVVSERATTGQSMLLVLQTRELRALRAIYLAELRLVLYLEPDGKQHLARNPGHTKARPSSESISLALLRPVEWQQRSQVNGHSGF